MKIDNVELVVSPRAQSTAAETAFPWLQHLLSKSHRWIGKLLGRTQSDLGVGKVGLQDERSHANQLLSEASSSTAGQGVDCLPMAPLALRNVAAVPAMSPQVHTSLATIEPVTIVPMESILPMTLTDMVKVYLAKLKAAGKNDTARDYASLFHRRVTKPFPDLAQRPASEISPIDITHLLKATLTAKRCSPNRSADATHLSPEVAQAQPMRREAAKLRSMLLSAFNTVRSVHLNPNVPDVDLAMVLPVLPFNPVQPVLTVDGAICPRRRILSEDELAAVLLRMSTIQTPAARVILLSIHLGGQRFAQVMRAKVKDYDPVARTIMLFDSKGRRATARPHLLPVGGRALELLEESARLAKTRKSNPSPWLFSSFGSKPLNAQTVSDLLAAVKAELITQGYLRSDFDARDLRRTIETYLSRKHESKEGRAHLMSHGIGGVQDTHYDMYEHFDEKVNLLRMVNEWFELAMNNFLRRHEDRIQVGLPKL